MLARETGWLLLPLALWGVTCALPGDFQKVDALPTGAGGQGAAGSGGAGGGNPSCDPFTLSAPDKCDPALLDDPDNCCVVGRSCLGGACVGGVCQPREMHSWMDELLDVVLMDDWIVYSTGYGRQLFRIRKSGGNPELFHTSGTYVTQLATDGVRVFYTQFDSGEVFGVDPETGDTIAVGDNSGHAAWFGGITVDDTNVYWVSRGYLPDDDPMLGACDLGLTSFPSVWYAPKDGSDPIAQGPQIPPGAAPVDVAADDEHLYWTDECLNTVYRVPLSDLGGAIEVVADEQYELAEIVVDDSNVYWIAGGDVLKCGKPCTTPIIIGSGSSGGTDLTIDATHVYWTSYASDAIYRAPFNGTRTDLIGTVVMPKGIAVDCDSVAVSTFPNAPPSFVYLIAK